MEGDTFQDGLRRKDMNTHQRYNPELGHMEGHHQVFQDIPETALTKTGLIIIKNYLGGQNYQWPSHENNLRHYTRDDLEDLSSWKKGKGGIRDKRDYQEFMAQFDTILNDLILNGYMDHEDEANIYLLNSLSTNLRRLVSWKLEKQIDKIRERDGGFPTPPFYAKSSEELTDRRPNNMIRNFGIKANKVISENKTRKETPLRHKQNNKI
ncbi:hypothetical protein BY996DRAFT_6438318 [Phakopsora pachyrhizi]|nr:hypothetical protein BY996DRAFT_6438318 [Phakopsora pachyrhizi]